MNRPHTAHLGWARALALSAGLALLLPAHAARASDGAAAGIAVLLGAPASLASNITLIGSAVTWADDADSQASWAMASLVSGGISTLLGTIALAAGASDLGSQRHPNALPSASGLFVLIGVAEMVSGISAIAVGAGSLQAVYEREARSSIQVVATPTLLPGAGGSTAVGVNFTLLGF